MKVILTQDVPKVGDSGTVQDVKPGFARNFLIRRGFAFAATSGSIKQVEERQAAEAKRIAKQEDELRGFSERIQGTRVEIEVRAGEQGRLFGSVTAADVAERLTAMLGEEIDRRKVDLEEPIRTLGEHEVTVRLVGRLQPTVTVVTFDPEQATEAAEIAEATETGEPDEPEIANETDEPTGVADSDEIDETE